MTNQELNDLLARFEGSSLSKLKLSTQEFTIEMERAVSAPAAPVIPAAAAAPAAPAAAEPEGDAITAPMVGTFYAASAPEQPPFVQVGDRVRKGQPVCLLEAMSYSNCVITSDIEECYNVIHDNGIVFRKGDVDDLAQKLTYALEHPNAVRMFKWLAAEYVCTRFPWDKIVVETLKLYQK